MTGRKGDQFRRNAYVMKRTILLTSMILSFCVSAFAQDEKKMAFGLGPEFNMNSRENFAGGAALSFDFNIASSFAAGLTVTGSSNFSGIAVIEPAALFRWYFLGKGHTGFFAQADAGAYLVLEEGELTPLFLGGLRAGFRLPLGSSFYIEPYGRGGYPFVFGIGLLAGLRF